MKELVMEVKQVLDKSLLFEGTMTPWQQESTLYDCILKYNRKELSVPFFHGIDSEDEPTLYNVVETIHEDGRALFYNSFEDWLDDYYGSDFKFKEDSEYGSYDDAKKEYVRCLKSGQELRDLLGEDYNIIVDQIYKEM